MTSDLAPTDKDSLALLERKETMIGMARQAVSAAQDAYLIARNNAHEQKHRQPLHEDLIVTRADSELDWDRYELMPTSTDREKNEKRIFLGKIKRKLARGTRRLKAISMANRDFIALVNCAAGLMREADLIEEPTVAVESTTADAPDAGDLRRTDIAKSWKRAGKEEAKILEQVAALKGE